MYVSHFRIKTMHNAICSPLILKTIQCVKCHTKQWFVLMDKRTPLGLDAYLKLDSSDGWSNEWKINKDTTTKKTFLVHNPGNSLS